MPSEPDVNPASEESEHVYEPTPVVRAEHAESPFTRVIEQQTAKLPSDLFLFTALGLMGASVVLHLRGRPEVSLLLGMWAPAVLTMGVYNKLVKVLRPQ